MTLPDAGLSRRIGIGLLTLYGLGVMVGAGIYVLTGAVAGQAGLLAPFAFLLAGVLVAPTAASYAELSARIPEAGGEAAYLREAFGGAVLPALAAALIVGGATLSASAVLQGGVGYLDALIPLPGVPLTLVVAGVLTLAAIAGVVESLALAAVLTVAEVGGLLFVVWAGFSAPPSDAWSAGFSAAWGQMGPAAALAGIAGATLLAFFAFIGFEDMVNMAEETVDPGRVMPRAILLALLATAVLYALVAAASVRAVAPETLALSDKPMALVAEAGAPGGGGAGLSVVAFAAAINGVLAQLVMGSRMLYGLARRLPGLKWLGVAHPRYRTPARATLVVAALLTVTSLLVPLVSLAATSASVLLVVFVVMNVTLLVLRRRGPSPPGAWTAPGWVPWAGIAGSALTLATSLVGLSV